MTKRKHKKKHQKRKHSKQQAINFKLINSILAIIIALILILAYIIYTSDTKELKKSKEETTKIIKNVEKTVKKELTAVEKKAEDELNKYINKIEIKKDKFEEYTKDFYEEYIDKEESKTTKNETIKTIKKEEEEEKKKIEEKDKEIEKVVKVKDKPKPILSNKPKLAIIFDDVTTQHQINKINDIGYTTTISAMPPTKMHPNSAKITKNLPFYMIHFPLEATSFRGEETDTLHIGDSYEKIETRVAQIRKWYPDAKYTNNHTGSKFTAHEESMDKLFKALVKYDFIFMDSRTTGKTVGKKMAKKYNMPYIVRNVFLDNEQNFDYIQNQLKKAIKIAKKNGFAIAICHPHSATIKTLKKSKHLLKDLEMVYLNQIPTLNK